MGLEGEFEGRDEQGSSLSRGCPGKQKISIKVLKPPEKAFTKRLDSNQSLSGHRGAVTLTEAPSESEFLLTGDGVAEKSLVGKTENLRFLPPDCFLF